MNPSNWPPSVNASTHVTLPLLAERSTCQVKWTGLPWHVHQQSSNVSVKKETAFPCLHSTVQLRLTITEREVNLAYQFRIRLLYHVGSHCLWLNNFPRASNKYRQLNFWFWYRSLIVESTCTVALNLQWVLANEGDNLQWSPLFENLDDLWRLSVHHILHGGQMVDLEAVYAVHCTTTTVHITEVTAASPFASCRLN
jgi:hypothetical protein